MAMSASEIALSPRQFTRTAQAVTRRVDRFIRRSLSKAHGAAAIISPCHCCLRFERTDVLSARGWCAVCEAEFRVVMAKLGVRRIAA
jgi:hypothetical protein